MILKIPNETFLRIIRHPLNFFDSIYYVVMVGDHTTVVASIFAHTVKKTAQQGRVTQLLHTF